REHGDLPSFPTRRSSDLSRNSSLACRITSAGSAAGPALKLKTWLMRTPERREKKEGRREKHAVPRAIFSLLPSRFSLFLLFLALVDRLDALDARQALTVRHANQPHALRVAPIDGNIGDRGAHQRAGVGDQHDLVFLADALRADDLAVA